MIALYIVACLLVFASPSVVAFWRARAGRPRPGSLAAHGARLALIRLITVGVVVVLHVLLLLVLAAAPDTGRPEPGHQYGPAFESWRGDAMMMAILCAFVCLAAGLAIAISFVRELVLLVRTWRARARVLGEGEAAPLPAEWTPMEIDFGVGEETWVFRGRAKEGYREAPPILGWARGKPVVWRAIVGPVVSVVTAAAIFALLTTDMILSLGD